MNNHSGKTLVATVLAASLSLAGCATHTGQTTDPDDPNRTRSGALIGAGIGAVAGLLSGGDATERRQRAMIGAGVGAIAGGAVGVYQDRQEAELRRSMAGTGVDVVREGDNITLSMPGAITFGFDSAEVQPRFLSVLDTLSDTLNEYNQTVIEIAGHTDSTGSPEYNQGLSERRAASVDSYLGNRGVLRDRTMVVGAGQAHPIASNATESGRAQNRRVEITLVPMQG
ncbi:MULTISPECIES: OmpA family protein [unclassified Wenzhouxiangella]|uniref:OmpA family protein n=1 Tax=unclassified Wenzhouxiangella TaxID=2613841 RepID=UPI000E327B35|nr:MULTISPECIES: OmpA family protein [unclassified Wenzhouxiangella]RFF26558.1 OmpA family protein [Wenzhouxiangella sp. 15181]RFP70394.1 OmpA family protein [Wenzhouxiangella sp. 15190]